MKKIFLILILMIFLIFILNKGQNVMLAEPTLDFKIVQNSDIDKDLQINIRKIRNLENRYSNNNELITLLKDGVIYPLKNKIDFSMYEIFISKNNKYAYIIGENIYFIEDESSIRGGSGRKGVIFINPKIDNDSISIDYHQYYDNNETKYSKNIKLSEKYNYLNHIFNEKIHLEDFNSINTY